MIEYGIEKHKLMYHPVRVARWLEGEDLFPVYVEISPTNRCNLKCSFCALDYLRTEPADMSAQVIVKTVQNMAEAGVKSVMYAGEGEPLLHPDIAYIIKETAAAGLDVALSTNGLLLDKHDLAGMLNSLMWIRVSVNSGNSSDYAKIHGCSEKYLQKALDNIAMLADTKKKTGSSTAIGVQAILLDDNYPGIRDLAGLVKETGADYFTVKSYSEHPRNIKNAYADMKYDNIPEFRKELDALTGEKLQVLFRSDSMGKLNSPKPYGSCLGLPFFSYIDSYGNAAPCIAFAGDREFSYGNIYEEGFRSIWHSSRRKEILKKAGEMFPACCRRICRMDEINIYLWRLKHPSLHDNFI